MKKEIVKKICIYKAWWDNFNVDHYILILIAKQNKK